jgi:osmotically-inducible protein OsmY
MKSDSEIREDVIRELQWDPQIADPDAIGVAVKDGAVTLTGHVSSYPEKLAAAKAAERVYGVKAVANDLEVRLPGLPRADDEIARAIAHILEWNVSIPPDRVKARVQGGVVTLEGQVDHDYQRREVERMVRNVRGVVNVINLITVRPPVSPARVEEEIERELERVAGVDPRHIKVEVSDHTAKLFGNVHSLKEFHAAVDAAASAPGVAQVETHLAVIP